MFQNQEYIDIDESLDTQVLFSQVLLIEDDSSHVKLIKRVLEGIVGEIHHVATGEEAVRAMEENYYELVFCDLNLPDTSGFELIREIRLVRPSLPVIVMTSSSNLDDAITAMREGAWDYLVKVFSEDLKERFLLAIRRTANRQIQQMKELKLRAERDAFWAAVRTAQDGVAVLDKEGNVIFANETFYKILSKLGEKNREMLNVATAIARVDASLAEALSKQIQSKMGELLWGSELRVEAEEEQFFALSLSSVQLGRHNNGTNLTTTNMQYQLRRHVLWIHDITQKKKQERFQRDILSTTSHDLKGPLGAIVTSTELLEGGRLDEAKSKEIITRIASCARGAITLIDELLSARRIQDGMLVVNPNWYNINEILEDIVLDYMPIAKARSINFTAVPCESTMQIYADRMGLNRVLGNLISNAIKFTNKNGIVTLQAEQVGKEVRISITDSGQGIDPEERHVLFQRYARLSKHFEYDGTGLGLFVTKSIVDAHNGRIEVQSEVGVGSSFIVYFPHPAINILPRA
jgi:signal transduction histidine kinase